ncbi:Ceramide synthetase [Giardia muris]|uniref:Ceramide synthetase n=1 Tax=Giardia muris TaxID=5742 RepID=A0A4Z1SSQ9_GIAMU|nr:Ceramide synthetase [Giardia muris]|eukprot:TNJ28810.1 Ceramide synthetase [Giardia muris]
MLTLPITLEHYRCLLFTVPCWALIRYVITSTITRLSIVYGKPNTTAKKISESSFYFLQYLLFYLLSRILIKRYQIQPYHFENFYANYPERDFFDPDFNKFFMLELTSYIVSCIFMSFESRRDNSDYYVMLLHHVVACSLIITGYGYRHFNFGLIVANLHDVSDIFLESSKVINLTVGEPWSLVTFVLFTTSFFVARIVVFPSYIIIPTILGKCDSCIENRLGLGHDCGESTLHRGGFYAILSGLYLIDWYWMIMIFRMLRGIFKLEVRGDVRDKTEAPAGSF